MIEGVRPSTHVPLPPYFSRRFVSNPLISVGIDFGEHLVQPRASTAAFLILIRYFQLYVNVLGFCFTLALDPSLFLPTTANVTVVDTRSSVVQLSPSETEIASKSHFSYRRGTDSHSWAGAQGCVDRNAAAAHRPATVKGCSEGFAGSGMQMGGCPLTS